MSMQSSEQIGDLQELPGSAYLEHHSAQEIVSDLVETDSALFVAESMSDSSEALYSAFSGGEVDDKAQQAYELAYPNQAEEHTLHEHWVELEARGEGSTQGFINGLNGKMAEIDAKEFLEQRGFQNVEIAADPTQPIWDISAIGDNGEQILFQVKTGSENYAPDVVDAMESSPNVEFLVNTEIYNWVSSNHSHLLGRLGNFEAAFGPEYQQVEGVEDGLTTLSDSMDIDVPDGATDFLPYVGAIVAGARLIYSVVSTERNFKDADRTTKNKIQVVQTLTLMSRMGVSAVLAITGGQAGAAAGGLIGSVVPGVGNAAGGIGGGIGGSIAGAGMGILLNRRLQPQILDLALDVTGLTNDDLFYYKNKQRVDYIGDSIQSSAFALSALSAL